MVARNQTADDVRRGVELESLRIELRDAESLIDEILAEDLESYPSLLKPKKVIRNVEYLAKLSMSLGRLFGEYLAKTSLSTAEAAIDSMESERAIQRSFYQRSCQMLNLSAVKFPGTGDEVHSKIQRHLLVIQLLAVTEDMVIERSKTT